MHYGIKEIDEQFFLLSEYAPGHSLKDWLKFNSRASWSIKRPIFDHILQGVSDLHQAKIVHRDLKPSNIILTEGLNMPKIIDFGLIKLEDSLDTHSLDYSGSRFYKDPSNIRRGIKESDYSTDVYALGLVLYELIVGQNPWIANSLPYEEIFNQAVIYRNVMEFDQKFRLDALPQEVETIKKTIRFATMFDKTHRLKTVDEMRAVMNGASQPAEPPQQPLRTAIVNAPRVEPRKQPPDSDTTTHLAREALKNAVDAPKPTPRHADAPRPFPLRGMMTLALLAAVGWGLFSLRDDALRLWNEWMTRKPPVIVALTLLPTPVPSQEGKLTPTLAPTETPTPQPTPTVEQSTPTPEPTATPQPTPSPKLTPTPQPAPTVWPLPNVSVSYTYHRKGMAAFAPLSSGSVLYSGDAYKIRLTSQADAYLYIIQVDSSGIVNRIFPNEWAPGNRNPVKAGASYILPGEKETETLRLDNHPGAETIYALAYPQRQDVLEGDVSSLSKAEFLRMIDAAGQCSSCVDVFEIDHRK